VRILTETESFFPLNTELRGRNGAYSQPSQQKTRITFLSSPIP
jgi:hypothetical protein